MKKLIIVVALFATTVNAQHKNSLKEYNLNGKVKSVLHMEFSVVEKFGKPVKSKVSYSDKSVFNKEGNNTEITRYRLDGSPSKTTQLTYYDNGDQLEFREFSLPGSEFDSGSYHKFIYKYDSRNNIIEDNLLVLDIGYVDGKNKYEHDERGNVTIKRTINKFGEHMETTKYKYDKTGSRIEKLINSGERSFRTTYEYDVLRNKTKINIYDSDGLLHTKEVRKYIEYDHRKNWTKVVTTENGKTTVVTEREIDYYE
jgi:YD repeat-containing protein